MHQYVYCPGHRQKGSLWILPSRRMGIIRENAHDGHLCRGQTYHSQSEGVRVHGENGWWKSIGTEEVKILHLGAVCADAGKSRSKYAHGAREDEGAEGVSGCWKSKERREETKERREEGGRTGSLCCSTYHWPPGLSLVLRAGSILRPSRMLWRCLLSTL